ncbi:SET domain-containing protein [Carpediemonas membranifera]|uniref:[histone H3]-lysine(4) N-trimethyltransferase n=1 Tax=Carpediemonas membranifera TaxID=201153 RepID=A0A8J6AYA6_9EUKA|nr:SET domain-containing protein [Carpediemonas membranifera]|eukprot:KAG9391383.1 SET domain-containing protein [Carpediemonas membranifera]
MNSSENMGSRPSRDEIDKIIENTEEIICAVLKNPSKDTADILNMALETEISTLRSGLTLKSAMVLSSQLVRYSQAFDKILQRRFIVHQPPALARALIRAAASSDDFPVSKATVIEQLDTPSAEIDRLWEILSLFLTLCDRRAVLGAKPCGEAIISLFNIYDDDEESSDEEEVKEEPPKKPQAPAAKKAAPKKRKAAPAKPRPPPIIEEEDELSDSASDSADSQDQDSEADSEEFDFESDEDVPPAPPVAEPHIPAQLTMADPGMVSAPPSSVTAGTDAALEEELLPLIVAAETYGGNPAPRAVLEAEVRSLRPWRMGFYDRLKSLSDSTHGVKLTQFSMVLNPKLVPKRRAPRLRGDPWAVPAVPYRMFIRQSPIHDWGVFSGELIPADTLLVEYVGRWVQSEVVIDRRADLYNLTVGSDYMFKVPDGVIDATHEGNMGRMLNHSCAPNCKSRVISGANGSRVGLFTLRAIAPGEELTYDYQLSDEGDIVPCHCGAATCRGALNYTRA